jgi:hypothetical protein
LEEDERESARFGKGRILVVAKKCEEEEERRRKEGKSSRAFLSPTLSSVTLHRTHSPHHQDSHPVSFGSLCHPRRNPFSLLLSHIIVTRRPTQHSNKLLSSLSLWLHSFRSFFFKELYISEPGG